MKSLINVIIVAALAMVHWMRREFAVANTYDAAVETHSDTCIRTNDVAVTARHLLWKKGAGDGTVALCTASDIPLGTIDNTTTGTDERQTILLLGKGSTKKMVASGAINAGGLVYTAASGKVAGSGTYPVGIALTATTTDGDIVEVLDFAPAASAGISATLFDAHTVLAATADNTPAAVTIAEQRILGRITSGNIAALTGAQARSIIEPISWTADAEAADDLSIPITARQVLKTTGADAESLSLEDGAFLGQRLNIVLVVDGGGDATLTPTTASGWTTCVFADKGDTLELEWTTSGWIITGCFGLTAQPTVTLT